jgi:hypothetical protein
VLLLIEQRLQADGGELGSAKEREAGHARAYFAWSRSAAKFWCAAIKRGTSTT